MRRFLMLSALVLAAGAQAAWFPAGLAAAAEAGPAHDAPAQTSALIYDYDFAGTTGTVANSAPSGPALTLTLHGNWSPAPGGVHFAGNTTGEESVAVGRPVSGDTLNAPATDAVGFGATIKYQEPATGTCFSDTPNVTQVGRYALHAVATQAKLQLSDCADNPAQVFPECRFSGSASAPDTSPVVGTTPLVNGAKYNLICLKSPDSNGNTVITVQVTKLPSGTTTTNTFTVAAVGRMKTAQYLSAGNKYPLPAPGANTSQFVGNMNQAVYCVGSLTAVQQCLTASLPS